MNTKLRQAILSGACAIALGAAVAPSMALADNITLTGIGTWASGGTPGTSPRTIVDAATGDSVDIAGFALTVEDNSTADDGQGKRDFSLGAITNSSETTGSVLMQEDRGALGGAPMTVSATSIDIKVATPTTQGTDGVLTIKNNVGAGFAHSNTVTVAGDVIANSIDLVNTELTPAAGKFVRLNVAGNVETVDGVTLEERGFLTLNGTSAQTVTGVIDSAGSSDRGFIEVQNAAGVTFNDVVGGTQALNTITVASTDGTNSMATFKGNVSTANGLTLGNGTGTDTNTVTFDATGGAIAVAGVVDGTANDTDNVVVTGGVVTANDNWGGVSSLDMTTVSGGGTLQVAAGNSVSSTAINLSGGTLELLDDSDVTSTTIDGTGALTSASTGSNISLITGTVGGSTALNSITLSGNGVLQFAGDVTAATISETNIGTLDFDGNVIGNVSLSTGGTADLAASKNLTGTVDGAGNLILGGTNTISENAGSNIALGSVTVSAGPVTFSKDLTVTGALANAGTVTLNGAASIGSISGAGALAINSANTVSIIGTSAGSTLDTFAGSTLNLGDDATFTGAVTNPGTVSIALDKTLSAASFADGTGTYKLVVGDVSASTVGASKINSTAVIADFATKGTVSLDIGSTVSNGTVASVITNATFATANVYDVTKYLQTYVFTQNGANIDLVVAQNGANTVAAALTGNGTAAANTAITGGPGSVYLTAYNAAINNATSASEVNSIVESYQPATTANTEASVGAILNAASVNNSRIESQTVALSGGSNKYALNQSVTGIATGEASKNLQGWGQVFGQHADQGDRDGQSGYNANTYGIVLGFDTSMVNDSLLGVALTYSRTKVDADNNSDTTINNYQVSAYGQYDITETTFVRGQAGYARGKNKVTSGTLGDADYNSNQFLVQAEIGRNFEVMKNLTLTPSVGNNFVHYSADSYSQGGGTVTPSSLNVYEITSKVAVSYNHDLGRGSFLQPTAYLGYRYDIVGAKASSTSSIGGSAVFETPGVTPARGTISAGVGVLYTLIDSVDLSANFDYQHKSAFNSYAGSLKAAYRF